MPRRINLPQELHQALNIVRASLPGSSIEQLLQAAIDKLGMGEKESEKESEKELEKEERKRWSVFIEDLLKSAGLLGGLLDPDDRRAWRLRTRLEDELRNAYEAGLGQQDRQKQQEAKERTKRMTEMRELKARREWEDTEVEEVEKSRSWGGYPFLGMESAKSWSELAEDILTSSGLSGRLMDPDDREALRIRLKLELQNAYEAGQEHEEQQGQRDRMFIGRYLQSSCPFLGKELESVRIEVVTIGERIDVPRKHRRTFHIDPKTFLICLSRKNRTLAMTGSILREEEVIVDNRPPDMKTWAESYATEPPEVKVPLLPIVKLEMSESAEMVNIVLEQNGDVVGKLLASKTDVLCAISERFSDQVDYFCKTKVSELDSMEVTPWMLRREIAMVIQEKEEWLRKSFRD